LNALKNVTTGSNNLGLGTSAGVNLTTGSNDIDIGNQGVAAESNTIRVGNQSTQTKTFMAGVFGSLVTGDPVMLSSTGQLGIVISSARYKRDIQDMGARSSNLLKLHPVTFRYKEDSAGGLQYGLVAEEVEKLYPELVTHSADGQVQSVRYWMLTSMLLNELRKQDQQVARLSAHAESADRQIAELKAGQEAQRIAFQRKLATIERELAQPGNSGKLAAAFQP
jgi:hypothetical protein